MESVAFMHFSVNSPIALHASMNLDKITTGVYQVCWQSNNKLPVTCILLQLEKEILSLLTSLNT